jgi:GDPmannose 4,6-dehydratase
MKTAIITGVNGQDGSYLSELLLNKGYYVVGVVRRSSIGRYDRIEHLMREQNFKVVEGDICDPSSVHNLVREYKPHELYNLAAQSHVATSFEQPSYTFQVNAVGVLNILEAVRMNNPSTRVYQASTSEMFGSNYTERSYYHPDNAAINEGNPNIIYKFQDEDTPLDARSPYGVSKIAAHNLINNYKEAYGLYACSGILFNHESPRRGENFVTRKITKWLGGFVKWCNEGNMSYSNVNHPDYHIGTISNYPKLKLGNLEAQRDWGHAKDYVRAMWMMLQQDKPENFVIGTGETHTVGQFVKYACKAAGVIYTPGIVTVDPKFYRPSDVEFLKCNPARANKTLGWKPEITFKQLVKEMVEEDIKNAS